MCVHEDAGNRIKLQWLCISLHVAAGSANDKVLVMVSNGSYTEELFSLIEAYKGHKCNVRIQCIVQARKPVKYKAKEI